jgi:hypothetical protein
MSSRWQLSCPSTPEWSRWSHNNTTSTIHALGSSQGCNQHCRTCQGARPVAGSPLVSTNVFQQGGHVETSLFGGLSAGLGLGELEQDGLALG